MYLFFDHNGTLLETVSTTALRQNNIGVNKIYVHIQDEERPDSGKINEAITGLIHRYKKSNGDVVDRYPETVTRPKEGKPYQDGIFENKQLPFNKKRDLKHFVYGRDYEFFVLNIPSGRSYEVKLPIINADGEDATETQTITEGTIFDIAGPVLATISAIDSIGDIMMSLERIAFTVESNGNISDAPISASQFLWLLSEIIKIDSKVQNGRNIDFIDLAGDNISVEDIDEECGISISIDDINIWWADEKDTRYADGRLFLPIIAGQDIGFELDGRVFKINNTAPRNFLIAKTSKEFSDLLISENVGNAISYNGDLYLIVSENNNIKAKKVVIDIKHIKTNDGETHELTIGNDGITYVNDLKVLGLNNKELSEGFISQRIPIVEGNNVKFALTGDGKAVAIDVTLPETTLNGKKVTNPSFYAPTSGGTADGVNILVANGSGKAPDWKKLSLSKNGQTITLKLGDVQIGSFTLDSDKYISDITYKSNKIVFKYADGTSQSVDLNNLVDVYEAGSGLEKNGNKFSVKVKGDYIYIDSLYGLRVKEQEVADLAKAKVNGTTVATKNVDIYAPTQSRVANSTQECYVLMPNGTSSAPIWGKLEIENKSEDDGLRSIFKLNGVKFGEVKHTQEIYLDSVVRDGNKIVFSYNTASGKKQVEVDLADLVDVYEAGNGIKRDGNTFSVKIEPNSTEFLEATADGIVFKKDALPEAGDKIEMLEGATLNLASLPPEIGVIAADGIHYLVPEVELELPDGRLVYMQSRNAIPITAGEGVEFKKNANNTVSINAKKTNYGVENAGKFLVVGNDGSIVAESMTIGESMLI